MRLGQREIEWMIPLLTLLLVGLGLVFVYSASHAGARPYFEKQLIYVGVGLILFVGAALVPDRMTFAFTFIVYTIIMLMLMLVLLVGQGPTGRWLVVGPFHIQPSELAKLAAILALARFLSDRKNDLAKLKNVGYVAILAGIPFMLIVIEPDLGTSLVIPVITLAIAYWGGLPTLTLVLLLSPILVIVASINPYLLVFTVGVIVFFGYFYGLRMIFALVWGVGLAIVGWITPILYMQLKPYQRKRLMTFLNPEDDPLGAGYQLIQSKVAIGSGHFWGRGFLDGSQTQRGFLPEQHTDFIFSVIGEEAGFFGASIALLLFWFLIIRLFYMAKKVSNPFASLCLVGIATLLAFQVTVNVGMTIGIMPVTGLPLPLLSYGGSSLLTMMMLLGLATGFASRWKGRG